MRASQTSILKSGTLAAGLLSAFLMPPSAAEDSHNPPPELPATLPADHLAAFNKLMSSSMERMHTDMMVAPSGDPDRDFARMMIPPPSGRSGHGQGGAHLRPQQGPASPRARHYREQQQEIEVMRGAIADMESARSR
jgi:hypothetical protein